MVNKRINSYRRKICLVLLIFPVILYAQTAVKDDRYTISGYVTDESSGESLLGANIYDKISQVGTTTNEFGFYSITLPEGKADLQFSYIGYQTSMKILDVSLNLKLNIPLKVNQELDEIVVYGNRSETGINATRMGAINIPMEQLKGIPAVLGEVDIMKTIQMMPGVQSGAEGSSGIYVRGGGPDENLILLDGVPLYNVDHLFGFFSIFTPESVKKVDLYKGSFPARFGGRLSSVVDVRTNDGDMRKFHGTLGVGLLSAKLQFEGPIVKDRTSFNISARRSYIDVIARPFMKEEDQFNYYFYDFNAKVNHKFNDKHRLFLSVYSGTDKFSIMNQEDFKKYQSKDENSLRWGNTVAALRWNYVISPVLFSNTTVAYTEYRYQSVNKTSQKDGSYRSDYNSGIKDWTYSLDFNYLPLPKHHIKFGMIYLYHSFKPESLTGKIQNSSDDINKDFKSLLDSEIYAHESTLYVEDDFDISDRVSINAGLNLSLFHVQKKSYLSLQPRLSARFQLNRDIALKASYTQMNQNIHLLSSYTMTMPTDLWVPATKNIRPMKAHQYSLGMYYTGIHGWELSVEGYYKNVNNVLEYKDGAALMGSSYNWESKVEMGKGRSMGVEFMVQKKIGKTTGWLAYTLAKSDRKFPSGSINDGRWFPYKYDRRHNISLTVNHKFSEKIDMGASWEFRTGGTTTIGEQSTIVVRPGDDLTPSLVDYVGQRNNYRMPSSHQLSIGVNFHKKTSHGVRTWNISLFNVYNAMNPTFLFRDAKDENGNRRDVLKKVTILPLIPSVTYTYKF